MKLTTDQVQKVAKLANLPMSEEEVEKYSEQLSKILDYIEQLEKVDTTNVEPTYNGTPLLSIMRADNPEQGLSQEEALQNAKKTEQGSFVTKGIFAEE